MAIYHLSCGFVSRSTGRSSVQAVAYIAGEKLFEERRELGVDFRNRAHDVICSKTLMSEEQLAAFKKIYGDNFKAIDVWNALENFEDAWAQSRFKTPETLANFLQSAQTAQTLVVALPKELSRQKSIELFEEFARARFTNRGLMVQLAVHEDEGNPHGHLIISRRSIDEHGNIAMAKDRDIVSRSELKITRKLWADMANSMLEREGFEARITEKSFLDLGIDLTPSQHRGWFSDKLVQMKLPSQLAENNAQIFAQNKEKIRRNPEIILDEITSTQGVFSQSDMLRVLNRRMGGDDRAMAQVFEGALREAVLVGEGPDGLSRYTTHAYMAKEAAALQLLENLQKSPFKVAVDSRKAEVLLADKFSYFNAEQVAAVKQITRTYLDGATKVGDQLSVMVGRAGAGKTTTLRAVTELYQGAGATVVGAAPSAMAAQNLEADTGVNARTIDSYLLLWRRFEAAQMKFLSLDSVMQEGLLKQASWYRDLTQLAKFQLTDKHVLLVDEAGMIGTDTWRELMYFAEKSGAKIIAVGDDHQFKAIQAGDLFRRVAEDNKTCVLNEIRRQNEPWMAAASVKLSNLNTMDALSDYSQNDRVKGIKAEQFINTVAHNYVREASENDDVTVLAATNKTVTQVNNRVRELLKDRGDLPATDQLVMDDRGFAVGDKIVCLKNAKLDQNTYLKNGLRATITHIENSNLTFKTSDNQTFTFDSKIYGHINHGYAITTHKAQGQTLDRTLIAAGKTMDAQALYVALTRHKFDTTLFYNEGEFKDYQALARSVSRFNHKELVSDYTILPENRDYYQRVENYKDLTADLAVEAKNAAKTNDWRVFTQIKTERNNVGREILHDFDRHHLYVSQSNLTKESIEINCGLKQRPLSQMEMLAKDNLERYASFNMQVRELHRKITAQKNKGKTVPEAVLNEYQACRETRYEFATLIKENAPLYVSIARENYQEFGVTMGSIEAVAKSGPGSDHTPDPVMHYEKFLPKMESDAERQSRIHDLKESLNSRVGDLAIQLLGKPSKTTARELRFGAKGSISVITHGPKQGLYSNFETGTTGGPLTLIEEQLGLDYKDAFKWASEWLGSDKPYVKDPALGHSQTDKQRLEAPKSEWQTVTPAPSKAPDITTDTYLAYMLKGRTETARYTYKDAQGNPLGHVVRLEDKHGAKITPTLTYCENEKGFKAWKWQGFDSTKDANGRGGRPLFGLDHLAAKPGANILIVEGEKTCEAARKIFPNHAVLTWPGGSGAVFKSNWAPINNHVKAAELSRAELPASEKESPSNKPSITIWPDHDKPGVKAANQVAEQLLEQPNINRSNIKMVDFAPEVFTHDFPHKWDLADALPKGISPSFYTNALNKAPMVGYVYRTNQFTLDAINSRMKKLGQDGPITNNKVEIIRSLYDVLSGLDKDIPSESFLNQRRYDQAIYVSNHLSQHIEARISPKELLNNFMDVVIKGRLNSEKPGLSNDYLNYACKIERIAIPKNLSQAQQFTYGIDPTALVDDQLAEKCLGDFARHVEKHHPRIFASMDLAYGDMTFAQKYQHLGLDSKAPLDKLILKQTQAIVKMFNHLDKSSEDLKVTAQDREIQAMYMASAIAKESDRLNGYHPDRDLTMNKIILEGKHFAQDVSRSQKEITQLANQDYTRYQEFANYFERKDQGKGMTMHCLDGRGDYQRIELLSRSSSGHEQAVGRAREFYQTLTTITQEAYRATIQKQEALQQLQNDKGGPEMEM